jgi:hypothetical protein
MINLGKPLFELGRETQKGCYAPGTSSAARLGHDTDEGDDMETGEARAEVA